MRALSGLEGRVVLVTGAGRNIGRSVALAFASAGASVAVNVRENKVEGDAVAEEARAFGVPAVTAVADVSDPDADAAMVSDVARQLGPIDVLVHCTGIRPRGAILELPVEEWRRVMETNCSSFFYLARCVLGSMAERGFGRLIAIGGADASRCGPDHAHIAASKAALTAMTKSISLELADRGVTANVVTPTVTETTRPEMLTPEFLRSTLPIPRPARLDEIAFACLYLASDEAAYITGQTLRVNGGFEM